MGRLIIGEDEWEKMTSFADLPENWPIFLNTAIEQLNKWILPAYKFSPDELCLGMVVNTSKTPLEISCEELVEADIRIQNQYVIQQNLDMYSHIVEHAHKMEGSFSS